MSNIFQIAYTDAKMLLNVFYGMNAPYNVIRPIITVLENLACEEGTKLIAAIEAEKANAAAPVTPAPAND